MKKIILALLLSTLMITTIFAQQLIEGFETWPPAEWNLVETVATNPTTQSADQAYSGANSLRFSSMSSADSYDKYLVSNEINWTAAENEFSFYHHGYSFGTETIAVGWSTTGNDVDADFTWSETITPTTEWAQYLKTDLPATTTYVAIHYFSDYQYYCYIDDVALGNVLEGTPDAPILVSPTNTAINVSNDIDLTWTTGENTDHAVLYFADNADLTDATMIDPATSPYAPTMDLNTTYYWKVVAYGPTDIEMSSPTWSFTTAAVSGIVPVSIGEGTTSANTMPWNFYWKNSVAETIYLASELNIGGQMQGLTFYNTFVTDLPAMPVNIWVGETTQTDLSTYIPASQLTAVFAGTVDFPAGANSINITFDTPYNYAGGNLVVLTDRPLAEEYYSSSDKFFNTVTELPNRSLSWQSDDVDLDPETVSAGTASASMPNVTFYFITQGMGSVTGTVTDGTTGLAGVNLVIDGTNYQAMSTDDGSFEFPYVAEADDYTLTANLHGYNAATATFDVTEDQETVVDVTMVMLDNVEVTGQVITNDTSMGIQAHIMLVGYETYEADTDADGNFTIAGVFTNQTYTGTATAEGYQAGTFEAVVAEADLDLGTIMVTESLFPPSNVVAALDGDDVLVTWSAPGSGAAGIESFSDAFEGDLSNWAEVIEGPGTPGSDGGNPYLYVGAPDAEYDGNCLRADWGYTIDSWVISPYIAVTSETSVNFEFNVSYYWAVDPNDNQDINIQVSTDGTNWTNIWTEDEYGVFENWTWINVSIPLSDYAGQSVQVAFNLTGDDNANTQIDNVFIGTSRDNDNYAIATLDNVISNSAKTINSDTQKNYRSIKSYTRVEKVVNEQNNKASQNIQIAQNDLMTINSNRAFTGFNVWRFLAIDEGNEANWTLLTEAMITDTTLTDTGWDALASGSYKYAVKAYYTGDAMSPASLSNVLLKDMYGTVDGTVMSAGSPINGATVNLDGTMTTTDASGYFVFTDVFSGEYTISASAAGYVSSTQTITVVGTQLTTVDFSLEESSILISDSFETYADFALEAAPWTMVDVDQTITWGIGDGAGGSYEFEHSAEAMAYIVFNPLMTVPALDESYYAHTGSKYMACIAANATPVIANNDWMITQEFTLGASGTFNFWGKSLVDTYGLERFNVLVSDGSTNPDDFTSISGATYTEATTEWAQYSYGLDAYANQTIRVAIQCVSEDSFIFMVDDVEIDAPGGTDIDSNDIAVVSQLLGNYPNPFNPETRIAFSTKENGPVSIDIYNIKGQKVKALVSENMQAGTHSVVWNGTNDNGKSVASGVFFYRMKSGKYSSTKKMILMK